MFTHAFVDLDIFIGDALGFLEDFLADFCWRLTLTPVLSLQGRGGHRLHNPIQGPGQVDRGGTSSFQNGAGGFQIGQQTRGRGSSGFSGRKRQAKAGCRTDRWGATNHHVCNGLCH